MLEAALEQYAELSDQLLLHVFLRLPLWARAISREGDEASLTVRQLHRNPNPNPNPIPDPNPNPNQAPAATTSPPGARRLTPSFRPTSCSAVVASRVRAAALP